MRSSLRQDLVFLNCEKYSQRKISTYKILPNPTFAKVNACKTLIFFYLQKFFLLKKSFQNNMLPNCCCQQISKQLAVNCSLKIRSEHFNCDHALKHFLQIITRYFQQKPCAYFMNTSVSLLLITLFRTVSGITYTELL